MHHPHVHAYDQELQIIERNLRTALLLEVFVQFGFVVALLATAGVFAGGSLPTTPPAAQGYFVVGFLVTIVVIIRTRQMQTAAQRKDMAALQRLNVRLWALVALIFSAILPSIYLYTAAAAMPRR